MSQAYWPLDAEWYVGHISGYDSETARHHVIDFLLPFCINYV